MFILGIQGSPKKKSSSKIILDNFLKDFKKDEIFLLNAFDYNISPCLGCLFCLENGFCKIKDDMDKVNALFEKADIIIISTPIYFYSFPSHLKALVDRCQVFWAEKYILKQDIKKKKGFLVSVGGSSGKKMFECTRLLAKYFFDSINTELIETFSYPNIENINDIKLSNIQKDANLFKKLI